MPETKEQAAFTPEIDRRILEGYLGNRAAMFNELGQAGITRKEIVKRGEALGLSTTFLSQRQFDEANLGIRECLSCEQTFASVSPQNRLCKRCRQRGGSPR